MQALAFSRETLHWAASRAGQSLESFAHTVSKRESTREHICQGLLTTAQAHQLAKQARIPFGYLFLPQPPAMERPSIPDLRQMKQPQPLSDDFWETLEDVHAKQEWMLEYLRENGLNHTINFVGRFANATWEQHTEIAHDICRELRINDNDRKSSADPAAFFSQLAGKAEAQGILVFKKSFVKGNTRRALSEKEFRGFALAHPVVPAIFVNGRDAAAANVFTLIPGRI